MCIYLIVSLCQADKRFYEDAVLLVIPIHPVGTDLSRPRSHTNPMRHPNEKLCIAVRKNGEMMLRCDPEQTEELLKKKGAQWAMMKGKPMKNGWLVVEPEGLEKPEDFDAWITVALAFNQKISS